MTVIIGILCSDGVVLGSDSAFATGRHPASYNIQRNDGDTLKMEVIGTDALSAITGAPGLAQRFNEQLAIILRQLKTPFKVNGRFFNDHIVTQSIYDLLKVRISDGSVPIDVLSPSEIGILLAQLTIQNFHRTQSAFQMNNGWGLGALFGFVHKDKPQLIEFDGISFNPELKGLPDPARQDQDRNWRCTSMGRGSPMADAFLAHVYRVLFKNKTPTVSRAKLAAMWTLDHVSKYNIGYVGGALHLSSIEKRNGIWSAQYVETGEVAGQVTALENHIFDFGKLPDTQTEKVADSEGIEALLSKADIKPAGH